MAKDLLYPNIENCTPSTCISSKIMRCNRIIANTFRKHLKEFNITDSQLSTLFFISKSEEVNQKKIADFLFSEKSTVNRNINRLLANNYISIENRKTISITRKGKNYLENIIPNWERAMKEIREILDTEGEEALNILQSKLTQ